MKKFFSAVAALVLVVYGISKAAAKQNQNDISQGDKPVKAKEVIKRTMKDIGKMLERLQSAAVPKQLSIAAMCYEMAAPAEYIEYICPLDGEKTVFSFNSTEDANVYHAVENISLYRSGIEYLNKIAPEGMTFSLDETLFCKKHNPDAKERFAYIILKYDDGKEVKNPVHPADFNILQAFFNEKTVYGGNYGEEYPLKDQTARIKELLGI